MSEKRAYVRLDLEGDITLKSADGVARIFVAYLDNISFGGLAMYAREKIEVDSIVELDLNVQQRPLPLAVKGRIRHVSEAEGDNSTLFTMGLEFLDVDKDAVLYIIKRQQLKTTSKPSRKIQTGRVDFIPY